MQRPNRLACVLAGAFAVLYQSACLATAQDFESAARQVYLVDAAAGTVLYAKNENEAVPPAALAKLMTAELVFQALKSGEHRFDEIIPISEDAWRRGGAVSGGSTMFAKIHSEIALGDLIQAVIVQSANDACIAIAEAFDGSEEKFAERMTRRARELGLADTVFRNATGLPAEGQVVTMKDLVTLARHIWATYPEYNHYYSQTDFTWNKITQRNRNPLLRLDIGADGLGTGYTEESGYGIVASVARGGRRIFVAMGGMDSERMRTEESRKLIDWSLSSFEVDDIFDEGEAVGEVSVFGGERSSLPVAADGAVSLLVPKGNREKLIARIIYQGPLVAPVEKGQPVGVVKFWIGDTAVQETPVYAAESVQRGTLRQRAFGAIEELLIGWLRG